MPSDAPDDNRPTGAVDARFTLAAERTVLAWMVIVVLAGAFVAVSL